MAILGAGYATPVEAQIAGSIGIESDVRFRGYSFSNGRPAATVDIGYEDRSGLYLNGGATVGISQSDPVLLGYQFNAGYSTWIDPAVSVDMGVLRNSYTRKARGLGRAQHYTELYFGVSARGLSARVYYSPDYFRPGAQTLYAEVQGTIPLAPKWRLSGHAGVLTYLANASPPLWGNRYDWRATLGRDLGKLNLRASLSSGGPGGDYYRNRVRSATALTVGASLPF